jgi:CRISPR/Cas system-associated exonuclease Cas4 (RecB family)
MMSNVDNILPTFTGTEVGYYFICVKKLWWFAHGVEMKHEHEFIVDESIAS